MTGGRHGGGGAIQPERIHLLNDRRPAAAGRYVLYWMQAAQRAACNHALEHAVTLADEHKLPLVVVFGLMDNYPEANGRHYRFMLEGLRETAAALRARRIGFVLRRGSPAEVALELAKDAAVVVCDRGYMRFQRAWRSEVAKAAPCQVREVEGEVVVPVAAASDRPEIGARTLRPKLLRLREHFLEALTENNPKRSGLHLGIDSDLDVSDPDACLSTLRLDHSLPPVARFQGGTSRARERLDGFLSRGLKGYREGRSDPARHQSSQLSPYLQFGQISPIEIALKAQAAARAGDPDRAAFLEELIVRRELAHNFVWYRPAAYDRYEVLPDWARRSLDKHRRDKRPHLCDRDRLEAGNTHDPYFNAAMREMRLTGYMHNYMRMYWGKKILEYSPDPETAYQVAIELNNCHFLCGRGPNAFANVAWIFGQHDRPWVERPVFGQVRYMNDRGLERKFDIRAYVRWTEELEA